jgi:archaemetzincin
MTEKILKFTPLCLIVIFGAIILSNTFGQKRKVTKETLDKRSETIRTEKIGSAFEHLKKLHRKRGPILSGDWLASHSEYGQTFTEYKKARPNGPTAKRKFIYIKLIGKFTEKQTEILDQTIEYMQVSFGLPVKKLPALDIKKIPKNAQRNHPTWGNHQLYTDYLMDEVLKKTRPEDAVALIGFTGIDLYPDPDWNFVFGIASLKERVGLWSIYRNGDPSENGQEYIKCLRRTISTAIHETGHILTIHHCIGYECVMSGSNSRQESDRRNFYYCPSCLQKLTWITKNDPAARFEKLIKLTKKLKLEKEQKFFEKSLKELEEKGLVK